MGRNYKYELQLRYVLTLVKRLGMDAYGPFPSESIDPDTEINRKNQREPCDKVVSCLFKTTSGFATADVATKTLTTGREFPV